MKLSAVGKFVDGGESATSEDGGLGLMSRGGVGGEGPGLKVSVVGDMRDLHHHGCEAVMRGLVGGLEMAGLEVGGVWAGLEAVGRDEVLEEVAVVVVNGEGALHGGREVVERLLAWAERRRARGRVTVLLNASWFDNEDEQTRRLAAFDLVVAREPWSGWEMKRGGVRALEGVDLAVGVAMDYGRWGGGAGEVMVSDSTRPERTRVLERMARARGWRYVPVLAYPTEARPGKKSQKICRRVAMMEQWGGIWTPWFSPRYRAHRVGLRSLDHYLESLREAGGVVTGRFHTVCMALGMGVPLVAVGSNTPKIEAMLVAAGLDPKKRMVTMADLERLRGVEPYDERELEGLEYFRRRVSESTREWVWSVKALATGGKAWMRVEPSGGGIVIEK